MLQNVWDKAISLKKEGKLTNSLAYGLFGRASMRIIAHRFGKEKWCQDPTKFDDFAAIDEAFKLELAEALKPPAEAPSSPKVTAAAGGEASSSTSLPPEARLQEAAKQRLYFKVGNFYTNKKEIGSDTIFKLTAMDQSDVTFTMHDIFQELDQAAVPKKVTGKQPDPMQPVTVKVPLDTLDWDLLKNWTPKNNDFKPPRLVGASWNLDSFLPKASKSMEIELAKTKLFNILVQANKDQEINAGDFLFAVNPAMIFAGKDFEPMEIKLIPCPDGPKGIQVNTDDDSSGIRVKVGANQFAVQGQASSKQLVIKAMSSELKEDKFKQAMTTISLFSWVATTDQKTKATMAWSTLKVEDVIIPVMHNPKKVSARTPLAIFKDPKEPAKKKAKIA